MAGCLPRAQAGATVSASLFSARLRPGGEENDQTKPEFRPRVCPTLAEVSEGNGTQDASGTWGFG